MNTSHVEITVMGGVVHISPNGESKTFAEYAEVVFIPRACFGSEETQRVDLVWHVYIKDSLKHSTRANRGTGTRKRVYPCLASREREKQTSYEMVTIRMNSFCS